MIDLAKVKINNSYDYLKTVAPTNAEKAPDYLNNETWLDLTTGFSYQLTDETAGDWEQIELNYDAKITAMEPIVFTNVIAYLQNPFTIFRDESYTDESDFDFPDQFNREERYNLFYFDSIFSECVFDATAKTITPGDVYGSMDSFAVGDVILIARSRRNNGYYTITGKTDTVITVEEDIVSGTETCFIFLTQIPDAFIFIVARMIWYDVYKRSESTGMKSERIGSYSYTKDDGGVLGYPGDVSMGLGAYMGITIGGMSFFVD